MIDFYVGIWSCVIEETIKDGFAAFLFYSIPAVIMSIPLIILGFILLSVLCTIVIAIIDSIKVSKENSRVAAMTEEERRVYFIEKERQREQAEREAYEREIRMAEFRNKLGEVNRQMHRCPVCHYADPDNEFLTLDGKPTGKHRCRNCGHHW